jgi:hypothetical protein
MQTSRIAHLFYYREFVSSVMENGLTVDFIAFMLERMSGLRLMPPILAGTGVTLRLLRRS